MRNIVRVVAVALLAAGLVGCEPPSVAIDHVLPAALPIPDSARPLRAGQFQVTGDAGGGYAEHLAAALNQRLGDANAPAGGGGAVDGTIEVDVADETGNRTIRRVSAAGESVTAEVPTLVRTASVRVVFAPRGPGGQALPMAEVRRSYSSAGDAAVRGPLGFKRADDPARVPPASEIVRGLLDDCADAFVRMTTPARSTVTMPLRPGGADTSARPESVDAHYNAAVAAEAAGRYEEARRLYLRAWELSKEHDLPSHQAADRLAVVLAAKR